VDEDHARPWMDAFFFRTSAMVSSNKHMILSVEQVVQRTAVHPSSSTTLSGLIGYAAVIADNHLAKSFFIEPTFTALRTSRMPVFFLLQKQRYGQ